MIYVAFGIKERLAGVPKFLNFLKDLHHFRDQGGVATDWPTGNIYSLIFSQIYTTFGIREVS